MDIWTGPLDKYWWSLHNGMEQLTITLGIAAVSAGHAAFDHAQVVASAGGAGCPGALAGNRHLGLGIRLQAEALACEKADRDEMGLDHAADRREDRGDVLAAHPGAAARVEHRLEFLDHEGHVPAATKHRRDHPGKRDGPGEMLHVLGVYED